MTDQPQFDNPAFPEAMLAVAHHDTPENRRTLYESMLKTWFLVPTRDAEPPDTPGLHDIKEDTAQSFSLEHDPAGLVVLPAFTDEEALRNWNNSILWIALQGAAFFQAVVGTQVEEIVINPYEIEDPASKMIRPGGRVTRWEFELLAQCLLPQPNMESTDDEGGMTEPESPRQMLLSTPKIMPPQELFDALIATAKSVPEVKAMYFCQLTNAYVESRRIVAVEFAPGIAEAMITATLVKLGKLARQFSPEEWVDFEITSTELGRAISMTGQKFY